MTGIERLREVVRELGEFSFCYDLYETLGNIADQIERERACDEDTIENVRLIVGGVVDEMEHHVLGHEGMEDSPVARWARELREALGGDGSDPAADVSVSAYDLLPQEDRDAIAWVREHGGIAYVKDAWNVRRNLDRQLEKAQAKVERQQRHIESIKSKLSERREHIENIANDVRNQCLAFGVDVSECDDEFDMLHDLNEALSKRLMPVGMEWPRFQDGEPVPLGGEVTVTVHDEDGDFDRTLAIRSIKYKESGVLLEGTKNEMVILSHGERVKRPAPKVLDADGVEIRVGDTVWHVHDLDKFTVTNPNNGENLSVTCMGEDGNEYCCYPNGLTHRAPVLAADGEPLREGETVWDWNGDGYVVERIYSGTTEPDFPGHTVACRRPDDIVTHMFKPSQLTHERPETRQSIADETCEDMVKRIDAIVSAGRWS